MPRARSGKGVDLLPILEVDVGVLDALAADAQATLLAQTIENVNSLEDYGSGSIKGLRLRVMVKPEAVIEYPPRLIVLILPSGMSTPSLITKALMKQNERFIWGDISLAPYSDPTANTIWWADLHLKTARRFHSGDVMSFVVHNTDPAVAFGAQGSGYMSGRAYVSED